jgi:chorismate-pyruvate lyase
LFGPGGYDPVYVTQRSTPELAALAGLYYGSVEELGKFQEVGETGLPSVYRMLLAHDKHMTVTLEAHYGCPVEVAVLDSTRTDMHYRRKVVLKRQTDGGVVLFGIVRITRALLSPEIRDEIEGEGTPLGRILISQNVLRNVRLLALFRVTPGRELCQIFGFDAPQTCYGRTALIYCDTVPVIELLEIVTAT